VVRGYSDDCSGGEIFLMQAKYRITGHTYSLGVATLALTYMSGYGSYVVAKFYHIIVGADPAPIGPTGPCCTGPTGPTGPRGIDGIGANGVWEEALAIGVGGIPGKGAFAPLNAPAGIAVADPSLLLALIWWCAVIVMIVRVGKSSLCKLNIVLLGIHILSGSQRTCLVTDHT